jgi:plastocyanin
LLLLLAVVLAAAVVVLPTVAGSETSPTVEAINKPGSGIYAEEHHAWSPAQATVTAGGVVAFRNASATVPHGVQWVSGPGTPTCSGVPVATDATTSGTSWSGTCSFAQAGTYTFYCTVHGPEMTGTIVVSAAASPTPIPMPPPTPTPSGEPTPAGAPGSPLAGGASQAIKLRASQRGRSVRGTVQVAQSGVGGRLEVELLTKGASLARAGRSTQVRVGRLVRSSLYAGTVAFSVPLDAKAKHALARHRRLALTVRIVLAPLHGSAVRITRGVVLHM